MNTQMVQPVAEEAGSDHKDVRENCKRTEKKFTDFAVIYGVEIRRQEIQPVNFSWITG